jgi:hypothetical protein
MQPGAKQPVDNQRDILWPGNIRGVNGATGVQPRITRGAGFFRQRFLALRASSVTAMPSACARRATT